MKNRMQNLIGETITTTDGKKYKLGAMAGYGAQGVVYDTSDPNAVIKLYYPSGSTVIDEDILERIKYIRDVKMPPNFVEIKAVIDEPYIGYVMDKVENHKPLNSYLIPDSSMSFSEWYNHGLGLRERIFIGYIIAKAFGKLEANNLSYCDLSGNNILVHVGKTASVRMIDVDNIYTPGKGSAAILGTPRYIAPEVISRQKNPDVLSDNYSLAVLIFEILRIGHPYISDDVLDGTPEDEEAALAGKAEYVNEDNSTNMLPADVVFTDSLKKLFERCFIDGKNNRMMRPSAKEFEFALLEASNKVIKCPSCGAWHYPRKTGRTYDGCPWCDEQSKPKARLNFYDVLTEGGDYRAENNKIEKKIVNTYILRDNTRNRIKSLYVLRADDPEKAKRSDENYMSIVKDERGYWAYNEHSKEGIVLRRIDTREYFEIGPNKALKLKTGDSIYFEMSKDKGVTIDVGGRNYSFIRMATFMEEA